MSTVCGQNRIIHAHKLWFWNQHKWLWISSFTLQFCCVRPERGRKKQHQHQQHCERFQLSLLRAGRSGASTSTSAKTAMLHIRWKLCRIIGANSTPYRKLYATSFCQISRCNRWKFTIHKAAEWIFIIVLNALFFFFFAVSIFHARQRSAFAKCQANWTNSQKKSNLDPAFVCQNIARPRLKSLCTFYTFLLCSPEPLESHNTFLFHYWLCVAAAVAVAASSLPPHLMWQFLDEYVCLLIVCTQCVCSVFCGKDGRRARIERKMERERGPANKFHFHIVRVIQTLIYSVVICIHILFTFRLYLDINV